MKRFFNDKGRIPALLLCFVAGGVFILLFSYSTSPLYHSYYGGDSAQFLTMGWAWTQGRIPYRDMFDHKGPWIFFVDMIGFSLGHGKSGVSVIQFIFMCFTVSGIFALSQIENRNNAYGVIAVLFSLIALKLNYVAGNMCEEYCLPFLCWSTYGLMKYYHGGRKEHDPRWSFLYGICGGGVF